MNQKEKTYVLKRIDQITQEKLTAINAYPQMKQLTNGEKITKLRSGDYKIIAEGHQPYWYNIIDFGEVKFDSGEFLKERTRLSSLIKTESNKLKDQVMLGSENDDILKLLNEFMSKEFK